MPIVTGTRLGSYEIVALLGAGGMGEVYRARDTKLGRDVALKVLPDVFASDPDRLARFKREAQVLASLNHVNIAAIYGLEEVGDVRALVLELVEGPTLAERIGRPTGSQPMSFDEVLTVARQIVSALEAAHEKGVVHRDLKPANVKITPEGVVKVLDFGLAKAMDPVGSGIQPGMNTNSPTLSMAATLAGVILGTAAYMSPEQAKGAQADQRSDVFSFGCVLYEMLTGRQAFQADTAAETMAAVLMREPDLAALPPNLHPRLADLLRRCLAKSPKGRWQAVGDLRLELEAIAADPRGTTEVFVQPFPTTGTKYQISTDGGRSPVWSPDGKYLYYDPGVGGGAVGKLVAVEVQTQPTFSFGSPASIPMPIERAVLRLNNTRYFDMTPDGKQFLVVMAPGAENSSVKPPPEQINVVLNWFEELKRRVPTK